MKRMKKLFAILMTMAMVMGLGITGFAAVNNNQISVSGTGLAGVTTGDEAESVKYGQIIMEDRESTIGWKFVNESIQTDFVNAYNSAGTTTSYSAEEILVEIGNSEKTENANASAGTISSDEKFSAALAAVTNVATIGMSWDDSDSSWKSFNNLTKGLYVVVANKSGYSYLPMAAYINSNGTGVEVVAKGSENQIYKTIDGTGESVAPEDTVEYTVKQQYLYYAPNTVAKNFTVTDTITNGTLNNSTLKVYLTDTSDATPTEADLLIKGTDYTITAESNTGYTIDFGTNYNSAYAGKTIQIKYTVTVGKLLDTDDMILKNQVASSNGTGAIVETEPVSFTVEKQDSVNGNPLDGAIFTIYKDVVQGTENAVELTVNGTTKYGVVVTTITTGDNGKATYDKLDAEATYYVKETTAPDGYSLNNTVYQLVGATVTPNSPINEVKDGVTYKKYTYNYTNFNNQVVTDTTLAALPSTGGMGTTLFTIAGCVIMISAAGLFFATRKKAN